MKNKIVWLVVSCLLVVAMLLVACAQPAEEKEAARGKPAGTLVARIGEAGTENWIPWLGGSATESSLWENVYDFMIYVNEETREKKGGILERWETSPDALTTTLWIRKGIPFHESEKWGEVTAEDIKYLFERLAEEGSLASKAVQVRKIESMEVVDTYTLVVHLKKEKADPIWWTNWMVSSLPTEPVTSKKYVETVGDDVASREPIGTGPYRVVEHQVGDYAKFEAFDEHWRVVPEFKNLTLMQIPEISTTIAALKTGQIDCTSVPADKIAEIKAAGFVVETAEWGGGVVSGVFGGNSCPEDTERYNPDYHNKDPWADVRVREAMAISVDRDAISQAILFGAGKPRGVHLQQAGSEKYLYPYDPERAKQLLAEAGYPDGFSFKIYSWARPGTPEMPAIIGAVAGYWAKIGLDASITMSDLPAYRPKAAAGETAGEMYFARTSWRSDFSIHLARYWTPGGVYPYWLDSDFIPLANQILKETDWSKRVAGWDEALKRMHEEVHLVPIVRIPNNYAYNGEKMRDWPHGGMPYPQYWQYIRHAEPLNTFRLFSP
ncbi:ABC transporter substrate-binding protein [Chloroflexota bacterium]